LETGDRPKVKQSDRWKVHVLETGDRFVVSDTTDTTTTTTDTTDTTT
jgi:hypothetical protein